MSKLKYKKFKKYEVDPESIGFENILGENYKFVFPNGYGASVIKNFGSYGFKEDKFEIAVLKKVTDNYYELCYTTEIANNVIGWLNNKEVLKILKKIKKL